MFTQFSLPVWVATVAGLILIVVLDLTVIARRNRTVALRDAVLWVCGYVGLASLFAVGLFVFESGTAGGQFVAGYITEYCLSVDNLFVFVLLMARFAVPPLAQDKALYVGIVLSMLLRAIFIVAGAGAVAAANWVFYIFGALLFYTAVRLLFGGDDEPADFRDNIVIRGLGRILPTTPDYVGSSVITRVSGRRMLTPLILVISAIGIANVVFALDSLPAIFGLTQDAYIIVTANAFALMGLRQLFFLVGDLLERLAYLNIGLAAILAFISVKLVFEALHGSHVDAVGPVHVPTVGIVASLTFIVLALGLTAFASLVRPPARGIGEDG